MSLFIPADQWRTLLASVSDGGRESAAIGLCNVVATEPGPRMLLHKVITPGPEDYARRGTLEAELSPTFVATAVREARDRKMATVFVHTHPFAERGHFSAVDDAGERLLLDFVNRRAPHTRHLALVLGRVAPSARLLGTQEYVPVRIVAPTIERFDLEGDDRAPGERFERQIRAFGPDVQRRLEGLRVAIVGLGGTGSIVAEQLAHLGVGNFTLIDPDVVEMSNLNRVVGATAADLGRPKVAVAAELIARIHPNTPVAARQASVLKNDELARLREVDAIFCCTDSHGSRYVLNELAYRFLVPCFDCGVAIAVENHTVTHVSARVQMLAPGLSCLTCEGVLDPEQVRRDLLSDFERSQDVYIQGASVPQPAVVSINATAVSLAVTMFLGAFCDLPVAARNQRYDGMRGTVRPVQAAQASMCVTCSLAGGLAAGDSWPLPGRSS